MSYQPDPRFPTMESVEEYNKSTLCGLMEKYNIDEINISYDGCGDSGQINDIYCGNLEFIKAPATVISASRSWTDSVSRILVNISEQTVEQLVEQLTYDKLSENYPGWEINDGSYGEIAFRRDGGGVIGHNVRIEEHEEIEF